MSEHRRRYEAKMEHVQHAEGGYDRSDLGARGIVIFLIGLAATVALIHFIVWGFMRTYAHFEAKPLTRTLAISVPEAQIHPTGNPVFRFPAPQLQPDETGDMEKYREEVEQQLNSSGWIDQDAGIVHIPVERAIDLIAERGLPVRPPETPAQPAKTGSGGGPAEGAAGGTVPQGNK